MRSLLPCPACGRHVFSNESECPFCKAATRRPAAPALMVGGALLVAAACGGNVEVPPSGQGGAHGGTGGATAQTQAQTSSVSGSSGGITIVTVAPVADAGALPDGRDFDASICAQCGGGSLCVFCTGCSPPEWTCQGVPIYHSPPPRSEWS